MTSLSGAGEEWSCNEYSEMSVFIKTLILSQGPHHITLSNSNYLSEIQAWNTTDWSLGLKNIKLGTGYQYLIQNKSSVFKYIQGLLHYIFCLSDLQRGHKSKLDVWCLRKNNFFNFNTVPNYYSIMILLKHLLSYYRTWF